MAKHLVNFESGSHWYRKDGQPSHDSDLRDARKEGLYPSVTTIIKDQFKNAFLEKWKINQTLIAAGDSLRQPHESAKDYAERIWEMAMEKATTAAEFGGRIHEACDKYPEMPSADLIPWFTRFGEWYDSAVEVTKASECVLLDHDLGVAGRTDRIAVLKYTGKVAIIDYKTQDVKVDKKGRKTPAFYDDFPRQLGFYATAHAKHSGMFPEIPECISVIIDSNPDGLIYPKTYDKEEILNAYEEFVLEAYRWFNSRGYWPQPNGPFSVKPSIPMPQ